MTTQHRVLLSIVACLVALALPGHASAQYCGSHCSYCSGSPNYWYGTVPGGSELYMTNYCTPDWCAACPFLTAQGDQTSVDQVVAQLDSAEPQDIEGIAAEYGEFLLINPTRDMVVVMGGCSGDGPAGVAFVRPEAMEALQRLGVRHLDEYLAAKSTTSAATALTVAS